MDINKQRILMKAFVSLQFSYTRLIWMFRGRKMEYRINSIHKRDLKFVNEDSHDLIFQQLLTKEKWGSVDQKMFSCWWLRYLNLKLECRLSRWRIFSILWKGFIIWEAIMQEKKNEIILSIKAERVFLSFIPNCGISSKNSPKNSPKFWFSQGIQNKN